MHDRERLVAGLGRLVNQIRRVVISSEAEMQPKFQSLVMRIRDRFITDALQFPLRFLGGNPASPRPFNRGWSPTYKM
jgi:hypothetical protein